MGRVEELKAHVRKLNEKHKAEADAHAETKREVERLTTELHQLKQALAPKPVAQEAPVDGRLNKVRKENRELLAENTRLARNAQLSQDRLEPMREKLRKLRETNGQLLARIEELEA